MAIKTIFSGNKKHARPAFVFVCGDGRGWDYKYENRPTRKDRERVEEYRDDVLYRINVFPKRAE